MLRIHCRTLNTESLAPSCRISPKAQDHSENILFQWGPPVFPNIARDKVCLLPWQKDHLFIVRGGIIWDWGGTFSKFIDRESHRIHLTGALGEGLPTYLPTYLKQSVQNFHVRGQFSIYRSTMEHIQTISELRFYKCFYQYSPLS